MPRGKKKTVTAKQKLKTITPVEEIVDNEKLSQPIIEVPAPPIQPASQLEAAMALLIQSQTQSQALLTKIADWIDQLSKKGMSTGDQQLDLVTEQKTRPFKMKIRYDLQVRTYDMGEWIFEYEDTNKKFYDRKEAMDYGNKNYGEWKFRLLQIEQPISFNS